MLERWADWLNPAIHADEILIYLPPGMLEVTQAYLPTPDQSSLAL